MKIQYNRNRSYDYTTGRWLQRDPIGVNPAGGTENQFRIKSQYKDGYNLYEYVSNKPTISMDPYGLLKQILPILPLIILPGPPDLWQPKPPPPLPPIYGPPADPVEPPQILPKPDKIVKRFASCFIAAGALGYIYGCLNDVCPYTCTKFGVDKYDNLYWEGIIFYSFPKWRFGGFECPIRIHLLDIDEPPPEQGPPWIT